jgi:dolichyl-phosphate beta-glucosyltransferase
LVVYGSRGDFRLNFHAAIVIPCFNESTRFDTSYFNRLVQINNTFWVFVDDGSTDSTSLVLANFCKKINTRYLRNDTNQGKSRAIANGMAYISRTNISPAWMGFIDSDGAFAISDIEKFLGLTKTEQIKNFDSIYSSRVKLSGRSINRTTSRHYVGRVIATVFGITWKDIPYDTQSGFKLYRTKLLTKQVLSPTFLTKWFFDIELHVRLGTNNENTFRVWEEPLNSWTDVPGSKLSFIERVRVIREIILILRLLFRYARRRFM